MNRKEGRGGVGGRRGKRSCAFPGIKSALSYYNRIMASQPEASRPDKKRALPCRGLLCLDVTTSRGRRGEARRGRTFTTTTTTYLLRYLAARDGGLEDRSRKVRALLTIYSTASHTRRVILIRQIVEFSVDSPASLSNR